MIGQQYYTRERGGLFLKIEGYDSVAKSPSLDLEFIKKSIHPLCNYDLPNEHQRTGEVDEKKYPPNFVIVPLITGQLLVGQAVYKNKDFTGLRSTFFMHNFILDEESKEEFIKNPEKLLGITAFKNSYNVEEGRELKDLTSIPYNKNQELFVDRLKLFCALNMDEVLLKKMLFAIFKSASSKKKVYICLNVPLERLGEYAKALLYHLYTYLPWSVLKDLGVSTYSKSVEAKKNINIIFVDKGCIRYDGRIDKEFVFDFENGRFLNVDIDVNMEPYFDIAIAYATNSEIWEKFNTFTQGILMGMGEAEGKSLELYNRLTTLFEMSLCEATHRNYNLDNIKVRNHLLSQALMYRGLKISEETKAQLDKIMIFAIKMMNISIDHNILLEKDEITAILKFKLLSGKDEVLAKAEYISLIRHNLVQALSLDKHAYIKEVLGLIRKEKEIYKLLMQALYEQNMLKEGIVYPLFKEKFIEIKSIDCLVEFMESNAFLEEVFLQDDYYEGLCTQAVETCMRLGTDQLANLMKIKKAWGAKKTPMYKKLITVGEESFLQNVNLTTIPNEEALCRLEFSKPYIYDNYETIEAYKALRKCTHFMKSRIGKVFPAVQELIKIFYKNDVKKDDFYMIVYAFLQTVKDEYGHDVKQLNFVAALRYLHAINMEIVLDFIVWSRGKEEYIDQAVFEGEVIRFFMAIKRDEGKLPKELIKAKLDKNIKTKNLYKRICLAQQSPTRRYINNHPALIGSLAGLIIVGGIAGTFIGLGGIGGKPKDVMKEVKKVPDERLKMHVSIEEIIRESNLQTTEDNVSITESNLQATKNNASITESSSQITEDNASITGSNLQTTKENITSTIK